MRLPFILFLFTICWTHLATGQYSIAYLSNESGNFDIYMINEDGSDKRKMTENPGWDWSPQWNPALRAILYNSSDTSGQFSIQAMTLQGRQILLNTFDLEECIFSPGGKQLLYTIRDRQNQYIGILDTVTKKNQLLIHHPSYNGRPQWSPDGASFSFISDRDGNSEIYVYHIPSKKEKRMTFSEKREKYTSWMPNGQEIVYTYHYSDEKNAERNDLFKVNLLDGKSTQLTQDEKFYQEIAVSPDGKKIVFHAKRNGQDQLYSIDINGKNEKQITTADAYHGEPVWIPN